jgi:hypothetical protein
MKKLKNIGAATAAKTSPNNLKADLDHYLGLTRNTRAADWPSARFRAADLTPAAKRVFKLIEAWAVKRGVKPWQARFAFVCTALKRGLPRFEAASKALRS